MKTMTWMGSILFGLALALACPGAQEPLFEGLGSYTRTIATIYLQAHHLDLDFYDEFYKSGAYLRTHAHHMARWHAQVHDAQ